MLPQATTAPTGPPETTTTLPGTEITLVPGHPINIVGPQNDSSDFFGLGFAVLGILLAIFIVRWAFRTRIHPARQPEEPRPGAPGPGPETPPEPPGPPAP